MNHLDFLTKHTITSSAVHRRTNTADSAPTASTHNPRVQYRIHMAQKARGTSHNRFRNMNIGSMQNDPMNSKLFNEINKIASST